jgi:hypothetical protein
LIEIDCSEMTLDEQFALASTISESLAGRAVGLIRDTKIVLDTISGSVSLGDVQHVVAEFVSKRKESQYYSVEVKGGDIIVVHSADPLARSRGRRDPGQMLPPNLLKCPFASCGFVTPYRELYDIHVKSHGAW